MSCCLNYPPRPAPDSPESLWENARGSWEAFQAMFGTALQLVGEVFIRRRDHNIACGFLRALEALVRRLLLVNAIDLIRNNSAPPQAAPASTRKPPPPPPPHPLGAAPAQPRQPVELDTEDETKWNARFSYNLSSLLHDEEPATRRLVIIARSLREDLPPFRFAEDLALRMEALRRVIADPAPWVEGMAARLRRRAAGNRPVRLAEPRAIHPEAFRFLDWPLATASAIAADAMDPPLQLPRTPDTS